MMQKNIFSLGIILLIISATFTVLTYETTSIESYQVQVEKTRQVPYQVQVEKTRQVPYQVQVPKTRQVPYDAIEDRQETLLDLSVFSIPPNNRYVQYVYIHSGRDVVVSFKSDGKLNLWVATSAEWNEFVKSGYTKEFENPLVKKTQVTSAEVGFHTSISDYYYLDLKNQAWFETVAVYFVKMIASWQETVTKYKTETYYETETRYKTETYTETETKYKTETYTETETRQRDVTKTISERLFGNSMLPSSSNKIFIISSIIGLSITVAGIAMKRPGSKKVISQAASSRPEELSRISLSEEQDTLKVAKINLEKERIAEMLKTFKEKYDKGEINEKTYLKLKKKYENELKGLE